MPQLTELTVQLAFTRELKSIVFPTEHEPFSENAVRIS